MRWRNARTCPRALCRLDPGKCFAARGGEAWRLPPHCEAPPGALTRSAEAGSGFYRSRGGSWARPRGRGRSAERCGRRPGPPDGPLLDGTSGHGAVILRARELAWGPTAVVLRRGTRHLEILAPGGEGAHWCSAGPGEISRASSHWCLGVGPFEVLGPSGR
ncbi:hypothetical protein NDU88_008304 [Pleurodeles waltl]|uniref:Uncharacterized protein n=1 Tax=Pleurodeles waltl TaxID=8319 RepID=A0AAV7NYV7_PLEWA|nr:hypothetical protein NDU88_008304 [Pleurodeles waltl]